MQAFKKADICAPYLFYKRKYFCCAGDAFYISKKYLTTLTLMIVFSKCKTMLMPSILSMARYSLFFILLIFTISLQAQTIILLTSGTQTAFRGLSVVSENIIWASGSNGVVAKSVDGGTS
ncbi:MAG: hypothetical protein ABIN95_01400, partial [Mucilaginibacter sp.]